MRQAKLRGWNRGTRPQRLGGPTQCDLTRQGKKFKCTDLALTPGECCSHCREAVKETQV